MTIIIIIFILFNFINTQFINVFNVTKPYELQISVLENGTFQYYDQSFSYFIDDFCSEIYYGEEINNDTVPVNSKINVLVYKGTERNFNFMLEINFNTPKNPNFIYGYEVRIIDKIKRNESCVRIISQKQNNHNENNFKFGIKDPPFTKINPKYDFYFGRISISSLTLCDHQHNQNSNEYCRISKSIVNLDAGIKNDHKSLVQTNIFQNDKIRESYHFNDRLPQICLKLNKKLQITLDYKFDLLIKLNDYYFITKTLFLNTKYLINLFSIGKYYKDKSYYLNGELITQNLINTDGSIIVNNLKSGLYAIELQPLLNTTFCKTKCPYQNDENSLNLSCETCKKIILYFLISMSKANDRYNCTIIDRVKNDENYVKLQSAHLVDSNFKINYPTKSFNELDFEINWLQIGVYVGVIILFLTIITVICLMIYKSMSKNKNLYGTNNGAEAEKLNEEPQY